MKNFGWVVAILIASLWAFAQQIPSAATIGAQFDHTKCSLAQTPQADGRGPGACIATDGIWVQFSTDAAPRRIDLISSAIVTSVNGKPGPTPVISYQDLSGTPPPDAVTSVNGKKGAVVITATTTVN